MFYWQLVHKLVTQNFKIFEYYLNQFYPIIIALCLCSLINLLPSTNWTRLVIKSIFITLIFCYLIYLSWHTFTFLSLYNWFGKIFNLFFYLLEVLILLYISFCSLIKFWSTANLRSRESDRYSQDVVSGRYLPSVDVFIPTYNEPESIVRRTVVACQAINYTNKKVYILDDTNRPQFQKLANELGCEYITRLDNKHAKAGNLNNALLKTHGELIAVFDADFVPLKNFLTRTIGFFQQPKVALVQTAQNFYNPDFYIRNLGLDYLLPSDMAWGHEFDFAIKDAGKCTNCSGTSYVVRRFALECTNGYETVTIQEDSSTSTKMLLCGFETIFLQEVLSIGEAPRTYADLIQQRTRWLHGNYQLFSREYSLPIWSKFNWIQKVYYFDWFISLYIPFARLAISFIPLLCLFLGVCSINIYFSSELYYIFAFWIFYIISDAWNREYTTSQLQGNLYENLLSFYFVKSLYFAIRNPFGLPFKVTPKSINNKNKGYNFNYTWPLIIVIITAVFLLYLYLEKLYINQELISADYVLLVFIITYQIIFKSIAVISAIEQPEYRNVDRFSLYTPCIVKLVDRTDNEKISSQIYYGHTNNCSESGAKITLEAKTLLEVNQSVILEFLDYKFYVKGQITRINLQDNNIQVALIFSQVNNQQYQYLVEMLYSNILWERKIQKPKNIQVFLALLWSLVQLKPLLTKYR